MLPPCRPCPADGRDDEGSGVVTIVLDGFEPDEQVFTERAAHDVAPLDEQHAVGLGQLGEGEVGHLVLGAQPVQVGVVQREPAGGVTVHQVVRGRGHVIGHAERGAEPLGERRLARTHLAGEDDDVTRAGEPDRLSAQLVDVDRSSDLAARAVGPEDEWAAELEITLNESALVTERTAVSGVEDAERVIDGWIRERFATSFEGTGHWEPYGEVVIEASTGGLEMAIDGQPVGATVAGTTRVREVRAGIRQVTLSAPRLEPYRGQIEVVQGRATTHQPDLVWVGPGRVFRTATIISGAVLATAGIVATVAALASHDGDVSTYCFAGSPGCSSGSSFESSGFSPSDADSLRSANTSGPLLLPLGYSLIGAGATWTIGALYSAEEDVPWLPLAIGAGVGVLAYSLSAASSTRPE